MREQAIDRRVQRRERRRGPHHRERVHPDERSRAYRRDRGQRRRGQGRVARDEPAADRPADGGPRAAAVDVSPAAREIDRDRGAVDGQDRGRGAGAGRAPRRREERNCHDDLDADHQHRGERYDGAGQEAVLRERRPESAGVAQLVARGHQEQQREGGPQRDVGDGIHDCLTA